MLSREECKQQLLNECQIIEKEGKYLVTNSTSGMVSKNKSRRELKEAIIFHTSKLDFKKDISFSERIYWIMYNINEIQKCQKEGCNNLVRFSGFNQHYAKHCSMYCNDTDCKTHELRGKTWVNNIDENGLNSFDRKKIKTKETSLIKYGVEHPTQNQSVKDKNYKSKINNIDENGLNSYDRSILKSKQTNLERYGDSNYHNIEQMLLTKKNSIDENGLNSFQRQALAMIETKLKSIDENGLNSIERGFLKAKNNEKSKLHKKRVYYENTNIFYQGSHEKEFIEKCLKENIKIENFRKGIKYKFEDKDHWYFPDFIITSPNGKKNIIEIKATHPYFFNEVESGRLLAKWESAEKYIIDNQNEFESYKFILNKEEITKNDLIKQYY